MRFNSAFKGLKIFSLQLLGLSRPVWSHPSTLPSCPPPLYIRSDRCHPPEGILYYNAWDDLPLLTRVPGHCGPVRRRAHAGNPGGGWYLPTVDGLLVDWCRLGSPCASSSGVLWSVVSELSALWPLLGYTHNLKIQNKATELDTLYAMILWSHYIFTWICLARPDFLGIRPL
jgi:hypothetical protein